MHLNRAGQVSTKHSDVNQQRATVRLEGNIPQVISVIRKRSDISFGHVNRSVSNGLGEPTSNPGLNSKNRSVRFQNRLQFCPLLPGGPILDPYMSTDMFCWIWLDQSVPISSCTFQVSLFIVTFRDATVEPKILTLVHH